MKQIPILLLDAFKKTGRSTCFLVKIVDQEGTAHGFASLDSVVRMDDGYHIIDYQPDQEMRPQNIQSTNSMETDNTELLGWFSKQMEQLVLSGLFNSAEITIYRVSYLRLWHGAEVLAYGTVGEIEYSANSQGKRKIEYRSLTDVLKSKVNDLYSLTCRADFGDENCRMPFSWEPATVGAIEDNFLRFQLVGLVRPDNWFNLGVIEFLTGPNTGFEGEVESWTADGWITLSFVTPYAITPVAVRIRQDCSKTESECIAYGNIINMQAEHLTPVQDLALMVPGAYIKSQNAL
jgi:uncharacterized phage protein (TIGR02218 family)